MLFSHICIGGGVTGIETLISSINNLIIKLKSNNIKKKIYKRTKILFGVIEKNPSNIPGGIAYGFEKSQYGYFNNPVRLSPINFTKWICNKKNKNLLVNYLDKHGGYTGSIWLKKNKKKLFSKNIKNLDELYLPRVLVNFWMEQRLCSLMNDVKEFNKKSSINIEIKFLKGELISIKKHEKNLYRLFFKNSSCQELGFRINKKKLKKINFFNKKMIKNKINTSSQSIGLGLAPPKQIATKKAQKNNFYIWDFYDEGSTGYLIKKITQLSKIKKKIKIYFIGYKAGLLESLPELYQYVLIKKLNVDLICSSKDLQSINSATFSKNKEIFKPKILKNNNLKKIDTAKQLYESISRELKESKKNNFNIYDAWTYILTKNIIFKCFKNFNADQKKIYNDYFHSKIRNITRFTYPETIFAREMLIKNNILHAKKEIVKKIDYINKDLIVQSISDQATKKIYKCDIVVNVSGPLNVDNIKTESSVISSIKKLGAKIRSSGFITNENFEIQGLKNTYMPGTLARGFNPERKTIINAILKNSKKIGQIVGIRIFTQIKSLF